MKDLYRVYEEARSPMQPWHNLSHPLKICEAACIWSLSWHAQVQLVESIINSTYMCVLVTQSCPTLYNPMDCSPPSFSVHGMLQVRIMEWIVILFSRRTTQPRDWTLVPCIRGRFFTIWATGKSCSSHIYTPNIHLKSLVYTETRNLLW